MKKVLQFSGIISLILAVVAFVLMLATPAIFGHTDLLGDYSYSGIYAIFGHQKTGALDVSYNPSVMALIAWILALAGLLVVLCGVLFPLLKVKGVDKFAGLLNLIAVCCFVVAGIFMFFVVPTFYGANELDVPASAGVGAGWVISAILYIVAGAFAILPAASDFLGKKKKR